MKRLESLSYQLQPQPGKDASPPTRLAFVGANAPAPFLFACGTSARECLAAPLANVMACQCVRRHF